MDGRKSLSIAFLAISDQYATLFVSIFFSQNGCRRPFWMTENHLRSHFSPFQYRTFFFKFTKWLPVAILDDRKSLLIAFLDISDQYTTLFFNLFTKWLPAAILDGRKSLSIAFLAISDQYATFFFFFTKWLPVAILDDRNHLRSHFSPFQINTQLLFIFYLQLSFFTKWLPAAIFDGRKSLSIAFLVI